MESLTYGGNTYTGNGNGNSVYLIRTNDSTPATDFNAYSAKRALQEFLSGKNDDTAEGLITFLQGLRSKGAINIGENVVDSLLAGVGTLIDDKRIQTNRIEVRDSLTVLKMIINEIQLMQSDHTFTDYGMVEKVEDLGESTYRLTIEKRTEADITSLKTDHILRQIVNNFLLGGTTYYTSWMRVLNTNTNNNTVTVVLYDDSSTPAGTNHPPLADYAVARWGSADMPTDGTHNSDSDHWYLSSREGAIRFLQNVFKPVLEDYNYELSIGKFPDIEAIKHLPIGENDKGILAKTLVAQNFYQYDYNGNIIAREVPRGQWSLTVAQGDEPYRNVTSAEQSENGTKYHLLEQHVVEHLGFRWACLVDETTLEPTWNSTGWRCVNATDDSYLVGFSSTGGWSFFGDVNTEVTAQIYYGSIDITERVMGNVATDMQWTRDTGNVPEDNAWKPTLVDGKKNVVHFTTEDMGTNWNSTRKAKFTCAVFIPVDGELVTSIRTIEIQK